MKTLLSLVLIASMAYGQEKVAPAQGPPPKNLTEKADGHFSANGDPANADKFEVYVVKQGDTLSQIAGQVLKNPALWPQLWEQNEQIVNPHWIYPNDKILIKPVTAISEVAPPPPPVPATVPVPEKAPEPPAPPASVKYVPRPALTPSETVPAVFNQTTRKSAPEIKASDMYCSGFIRAAAVSNDMKIVAKFNADEGALATVADYVYVGRGSEDGIHVGAEYQVVRPTHEIDNMQHKKLGTHYLDIGRIQVVMAQPDFSMARVTSNCESVEVGDIMAPFVRLDVPAVSKFRPFNPLIKATGDVKGSVVITMAVLENFGSAFNSGVVAGTHSKDWESLDRGTAAAGSFVYIDIGQKDGVKPGDSFIVYEPADKDQELYGLPADAKRISGFRVAVGELIVLKVEEGTATALVTYATGAILAGDSVERR